jgi:quercetin dioxygenase-like cupin family protein
VKSGIPIAILAFVTGAILATQISGQPNMQGQGGLVLRAEEGERIVRRWGYPAIIKVDPRNGGSNQFVAITEVVPPGQSIPVHKHPHADEIVVLLKGSGVAIVGDTRRAVDAGAMLFAPKGEWMGFENTGAEDAQVMGIFSNLGYEEYLRATSVPEGQPVTPLSPTELAEIRKKFAGHITFKPK